MDYLKSWIFFKLFMLVISSEGCYKQHLFSTKTPYALIQNKDLSIIKPSGTCTAVHMNLIHRHGHRYPSIKDMRNMKSMSGILNTASHPSPEVDLRLPWNIPYHFKQDKLLTTVGEKELFDIGKRVVSRFPSLFQSYTPLNFTFQSTCKLRCTHSAIALAAGLFDGKGHLGPSNYQPISLETHPCHSDRILRFFDHCDKYVQQVSEHANGKREMEAFMKSNEVAEVLRKVKKRLGDPEIPLKAKHLKDILIACAYEIGMHGGNKSSGICSLLDNEDFSVIEYLLDLKHFYVRSAGYKINYESACPLLADFVETMKAFVANPSNGQIGIFRSAHAETITPLFAILNISLDAIQMKSDNYHLMKNRHFRGACLAPFSGNLYFVLYDCGGDGYKVQLYLNERLVAAPCCSSSIDCPFKSFLQCVEPIVSSCHFDNICRHDRTEL